jgi:hypothetical protein
MRSFIIRIPVSFYEMWCGAVPLILLVRDVTFQWFAFVNTVVNLGLGNCARNF